ncbi:Ig-like domain-containing protein [Stutzerimonas balearica]|uniref:Ig-like domain-containing protein n=1 Tax=Stutzerimonas balearica TaxID=74829 RepID=UPI003F7658C6
MRQTDVAGNTSGATTVSFVLDTQVAAPSVSLTSDTGASGSDSITNSGALTIGGTEAGATVEYSTDGGQTWTDSFSAVEGSNTVSVRQTDVAGNTSGATTLSFVLDTSAPNLTVSIDPITADNTVNAAERAGDTVTVTGKVTGEVAVDDAVVLTVGSSQYAGTVIDLGNGELGFSINVGSGDLADNISITASVTHTDAAGNTGSAEADRAYAVDTSATAAPTVTISTDANNDGVLNNTELGNAATISITIGLPSGAIVGDMLNVNLNGVAQAAIQLTEAQIAAGSVVLQTARAADGDTITASATLTDAARNTSDKGSDSAVIGNNAPQVTVTASDVTEQNVSTDTVIATFTASDADNDSLTFSLLNNDNGYFVIDGNTVKLTQAGVEAINDDTLNLQNLTISVEASDGTRTGSDSDVSTITRVNDNAPQVTDASVSLDENVAANTAVINVSDSFTNTDLDRDGDAITYSITGGNSAGIFVIDAATGAITIAAGKTLDYETANEHVLTVTASDGALFDTANITVNVNNLPDTPPVVTASSALVSETGLKSATDTDTSNVASGKIAITHDAATVVTLIPPTTTGLKSGGTDITWSLSSDGKTLTGNAGTDKAIAITIDNQGNYSVSLLKPIDHPDTASADVLNLSVGVKVTDAYNNQSTNALTVQIQDDVPTASPGGVTISIPVSSINVSGLEAGFVNPTSTGGGTSGLTQANTDSDSYIDKINWGGSSGSGYTFTDNETYRTSGPSLPNSDFKVGTLTHNNFPVSSNDSVLSTVGLRVKLTVMIDGVPTMIEHTVNLRHTETPNNYNTQDPVNDDIIRLDNSTLVKQFTVGGRTFEFEIKGFLDPQTGDVVTTIYTTENAASAFDLYAVVKSTDGLPLNSGDVSANASTGADGSVAATGSNAVIEWTGATINSDGSSTISNDFGTFTGWPDGRYRFEVSRTARDDFNADQVENLKFGYVVIDGDGDRASSEVTVTLNGEKVVPYAPVVNQDAQTTVLSCDAGTESTASLGIDAGRDIEGASIKFTATDDASLNGQPVKGNVLFSGASESVALTSGGMALVYRANADGSLDAVKQGTNDVVFKVTGDVAKGTYSVEMVGTLDQATKFSSNTANLSFFQQNGLAQASTGTADLSVSLSGTGGTPYWSGDRLGIDAPGTSSGNENREFNYRSNSETLKINFAVIEGISVSSVELGTKSFNDGEQLQYRINDGAWQTIESNARWWSPNVTINSNDAISTLELRAGNNDSEFSIDSARVSYTKIIAADESSNITLSLGATVTDGSGDKASTDFNVVIDPDHSLQGTTGNDSLMGSDLADTLRGESGDDQLNGGTGNDLLVGGAGDDILIGGLGDDQLTGGSGADTFTWKAGDLGKDSILDFNASEGDRIDLSDLLQGENDGNLLSYLRVDTTTATLQISTTGVLNDTGSNADVTIKLENGGAAVDLSSYGSNPTDIINSLVADHIVKVDH